VRQSGAPRGELHRTLESRAAPCHACIPRAKRSRRCTGALTVLIERMTMRPRMGAKQHSAAPAAGGRWLATAMACALALFGACSLMAPSDEELQAGLGRGDAGDQRDASDGDGGDASEPDGDADAGADADAGPDVGGMLPHCNNKEIDPGETDVDCGGLDCLPCSTGGGCLVDSDCEEKVCKGQLC